MKKKTTAFDVVLITLLTILCIITLYPVLYVLFSSISDAALLEYHRGILLKPLGFSLEAYKLVFKNPSIVIGYRNTILYLIFGTSVNMFLTILGAYALTRKHLFIKKATMLFIIFTMQFNAGLIPTYIIVNQILNKSVLTQILPTAIVTSNLIIMKTAFTSIPASLEESAKIDGANELTVLMKIILPLSKPTLAVISLYYGVSHWNQWLPAAIYLRNRNLYPLQLFLREILLQNKTDQTLLGTSNVYVADMTEVVKYATIVVAIVPILCVYPFIQKFFVKGAMLGAVKE